MTAAAGSYDAGVTDIVAPTLEAYAAEHTTAPPPHLEALAAELVGTLDSPHMMVGRLEGRFLELLTFALSATSVLEVGTFGGYSALAMAAGLAPGGRIVSCELSPVHAAFARRHIAASPYAARIEVVAGLAIAIAGCWLSNPTVGVMGCYLLAAAALVVFGLERSSAKLLRTAAGAVLGMGLVAVYLVPASWEQRWVDIHQATQDKGETPEYSWLFAVHNDPALAYHDVVLHTVSTIAILMIGVALCALFLCWLRGRLPEKARWWVPLALIPVAVLLLQFPFSRPLWNLLPDLRFQQFPWRWLVVLEAPMGIFAAAAIWPRNSTHHLQRFAIAAAAGAVFLTLTTWAEKDLFQVCDDEDAVAGMVPVYAAGQGFAGTYEYEPIGADISLIAAGPIVPV